MDEEIIEIQTHDAEGNILHDLGDILISAHEIEDPEAFLDSPRGKAWFEELTRNVYFSTWYRDRSDILERKTVAKIANALFRSKYARDGEHPHTPIEEVLGHGADAEDDYYQNGTNDQHEERIRDLASSIEAYADDEGIELPELDEELWQEAVRDRTVEKMREEDDSSVTDMIGSWDKFELIVRFTQGDDTVTSRTNTSDWGALDVDQNLQKALTSLGHSIAEYRAHSGNRSESNGLVPGMAKRRPAIATLDQIREAVTEACNDSFSFVLFAYVKLEDVIDLDVDRPIMLNRAFLATYNAMNGTFYDVPLPHAVEIMPGEAFLEAAEGNTPDKICGMVLSKYSADVANIVDEIPQAMAA